MTWSRDLEVFVLANLHRPARRAQDRPPVRATRNPLVRLVDAAPFDWLSRRNPARSSATSAPLNLLSILAHRFRMC